MSRILRCKIYHRAFTPLDEGYLRTRKETKKSRCPGWTLEDTVQQALLSEALVDETSGRDPFNHPRRLWTAVNGWTFVAMSTAEQEPAYNCYPDVLATEMDASKVAEVERRAARTIEDLMVEAATPEVTR